MLSVTYYTQIILHIRRCLLLSVYACNQMFPSDHVHRYIIHECIQVKRDMSLIATSYIFLEYKCLWIIIYSYLHLLDNNFRFSIVFENMYWCLQCVLMLPVFVYCSAVNETIIITYNNYIDYIHNSHLNYNRKLLSILIYNRYVYYYSGMISTHLAISYR